MKEKVNTISIFIFMQIMLLLFSFAGVFSKIASGYDLLSTNFILFYGSSIVILLIYAIGWQLILRRMDLTLAFSFKALTIIWGMIWGVIFFNEQITWNMLIGTATIVVGIVLVVNSNR